MIKKSIRLALMTILIGAISNEASAQETSSVQEATEDSVAHKAKAVEVYVGTDIVSQYIWRGLMLGSASLQPTASVSWKGLSLSAWGSVGFVNRDDPYEIDFTLSYSVAGLSLGITDYWTDGINYFQYKNGETNHIWEAGIGYDFGFLAISWYTNFAGADGVNGSGNRAYSSYFELKAPFRLGGLEWEGAVGMVPWKTTTYDTNGFAVTNVSLKATKDFVIKEKYHLPVFAGLTANPDSKKLYLLCGISFSL